MARDRATAIVVGLVLISSTGCSAENEPPTTSADTSQHTTSTPTSTMSTIQDNELSLPPRPGEPPDVTAGIPHVQLDQTSSDEVLDQLSDWAFSLEGVVERPSLASLPGARALTVAPELEVNSEAMLVDREFAHIHPQPTGGSLHLMLPLGAAQEVVDNGWGEFHPFAINGSIPNLIMVYAPRDGDDLEYVKAIIEASVAFAISR